MMKARAATVEPVLGSLMEYYALGKVKIRRQEAVGKVLYLAAMVYNLKKYLAYHSSPRKPTTSRVGNKKICLEILDIIVRHTRLELVFSAKADFCNNHISTDAQLERVWD